MKRWLIICLLLLVPAAHALIEDDNFLTKTEYYHADENFEVGSHNVLVQFQGSQGNERVRLLFDSQEQHVFTAASCEGDTVKTCDACATYQNLEVCLEEITYEFDDDEKAIIDPRTNLISPGIKLQVTDMSPDITITRSVDKSSIYIGEEAAFTLGVENEGESPAKSVVVKEVFPSHIEVVNPGQGTRQGNTIFFEIPWLPPAEKHEFTYKVRALQQSDATLKAVFEYLYLDTKVIDESSLTTIRVEEALSIDIDYDPTSPTLQNTTTVTFTLTNNDDEDDIRIKDLSLPLPPDITFVDVENATVYQDVLSLSPTLEPEEEYTFILQFRPKLKQAYVFSGTADYEFNSVDFHQPFSSSVTVGGDSDISIETKLLGATILENETSQFWLFVKNEDPITYHNLQVIINSSFLNRKLNLKNIAADSYESVFNTQFTAPDVETTKKFTVTATGTVESSLRDPATNLPIEVALSDSSDITVYDPSKAITITRTIEPTTVRQNRTATVTVAVENELDRQSIQEVYVREHVPAWLLQGRKTQESIFFLGPLEERQAYSYEIRVPFHFEEQEPNVTTIIEALGVTHEIIESIEIELDYNATVTATSSSEGVALIGQLFPVVYTIKNTGEVDVFDVEVTQHPVEGIDAVTGRSESIEVLETDESIEVTMLVRPVAIGNYAWEGALVSYKDQYGNIFIKEISSSSIAVGSASKTGPLLSITKNATPYSKHEIRVTLDVENIGDAAATFAINDIYQRWSVRLGPGESEQLSYVLPVRNNTNITLASPSYEYEALDVRLVGLGKPLRNYSYEWIDPEPQVIADTIGDHDLTPTSASADASGGMLMWGIIILLVIVALGAGVMFLRRRSS